LRSERFRRVSYIIQEVDELLQLVAAQAVYTAFAFGAIVELAESDLKFRWGLGKLVKTPE
jgi:hypothetical protein